MDRRGEREARAQRLREARIAAGYPSARVAAHTNGWTYDTYYSHEAGRAGFDVDYGRQYARKFRVDLSWLMLGIEAEELTPGFAEERTASIPIMGYVGAGGSIEPEFEQVPPEGLEQIEFYEPIGLVRDPIGFLVRGESMMPRYSDGDIAVVERDQPSNIESMIGAEAVIRTSDEQRFLKKIMPGRRKGAVNLVSVNAPTIEDVEIAWASPVCLIIPRVASRRR